MKLKVLLVISATIALFYYTTQSRAQDVEQCLLLSKFAKLAAQERDKGTPERVLVRTIDKTRGLQSDTKAGLIVIVTAVYSDEAYDKDPIEIGNAALRGCLGK